MELSSKTIWKTVKKLEDSFLFERANGSEWLLVESSFEEGKFIEFLQTRGIDKNEDIYIIKSRENVFESKWRNCLDDCKNIFKSDSDITIVDATFTCMLIYNHIGVVKFGKKH